MLFADQIRVALAGNLADYSFESLSGAIVTGKDVDYNGSPAGYTSDPQEHISYVSAHDNETLFDAIQYKVPLATSMVDRVRIQNLALDVVMLGQGVPFFHTGSDLLRSKSFDRDSYNSGDWFNAIDWTFSSNNWARGLPVADKNDSKWDIMEPLLANPDLAPTTEHILANTTHFQEMLRVRASSPLFRLQSAEQIQSRLHFHNTGQEQIPGLIVFSIDDTTGDDLDPNYARVVALINATTQPQSFVVDGLAAVDLALHPVLMSSADGVVQSASFSGGTFAVPARTTAVFVEIEEETEIETEREMEEEGVVESEVGSAEDQSDPEPQPTPVPIQIDSGDLQPAPWLALLAAAATGAAIVGAYQSRRQ